MDNRSSSGLPRSAPALGYGGVIAAQSEVAVNRMHDSYTLEGSGNVNRLAPLPRGTILTFYFTDAPTFVHSTAWLRCPGSQNVSFAAGDAAFLRSQGDGLWRLLAKFPAASLPVLAANNLSEVASAAAARTNLSAVGVIKPPQKFTSSGTYTPDPHLLYCIIECVGGGGGGGGIAANVSNAGGAAGGGGGGYSRKVATASDIGASKTVTIGASGTAATSGNNNGGAGGNTSVGSLCVANGATGGSGTNSFGSTASAAGGTAGTGDLTAPGPSSSGAICTAASAVNSGISGAGASTAYGGGGPAVFANGGVTAGAAGSGYGAGGSGAACHASGASAAGGAGAPGLAIITEFCSQ